MGIRTTQYFGLPEEADELVANLVPTPSGDTVLGMYEERFELNAYVEADAELRNLEWDLAELESRAQRLRDTIATVAARRPRRYEEFVQAEPWSSGKCIFIGLRDAITGETVAAWSEADIDNA